MKKYLSWLVLASVLVVTGCGVPQEEHDAAVAQLQAERANVEATLNGKISDLSSPTVLRESNLQDPTNRCSSINYPFNHDGS